MLASPLPQAACARTRTSALPPSPTSIVVRSIIGTAWARARLSLPGPSTGWWPGGASPIPNARVRRFWDAARRYTAFRPGSPSRNARRTLCRGSNIIRKRLCRSSRTAGSAYVMLSEALLGILRSYWRLARPPLFLFPGRTSDTPIDPTVLHAACRSATAAAAARQARERACAAAQLRHPSAGERRRHPHHPGVARDRHILPATNRSRDGSAIRFILGVARRCSSSSNTLIAGLTWSLFRSPTDRSPAFPRG